MLALMGGTIYPGPGEQTVRNGAVHVRGDRITAVLPYPRMLEGAQRIDCEGATICAGFQNSHVHFFERKWAHAAAIPAHELQRQLADMLTRYGFTSVFDTSSQWENTRAIRGRIESGEVDGPAIRSTGEGLIAPGGAPSDVVNGMMGLFPVALPEIGDATTAAAEARKRIEAGSDGVKLFISSPRVPPMPEAAIAAAAEVAHGAGKPVFAHPNNDADVLAAVRGGVDIVAHTTPLSGPWDGALLDEMAARGVAVTPTLTLWQWYFRHDRISSQQRIVETAAGQLRAWLARGGEALFGTDLGAMEYDPSPEYRLMAEAGMSFAQILASLTTAPARRFGDGDAGRVAEGLRADLVVVDGDPEKEIGALGRVRHTVRNGRLIFSRL